ncbi:MAG: hypothetical protein GX330_04755, partial [Bacteroidales bacterium]|nr:hypothetical protein [Bacteroidales bacterium]
MSKENAIKLFEQKQIANKEPMPKASKIYSNKGSDILFDPKGVVYTSHYYSFTNLLSLRDKNTTLFCVYTNPIPQIYNNNNIKHKPMPKASQVCNGKGSGVLFDPKGVVYTSHYYSFINLLSLRGKNTTLFYTYTNPTPQIYNNDNIKHKPMPKASQIYNKTMKNKMFDPE